MTFPHSTWRCPRALSFSLSRQRSRTYSCLYARVSVGTRRAACRDGYTHYNERSNDGNIVYQLIGEGPLVMVTSPSGQRLIIDPANRVFGDAVEEVTLANDNGKTVAMEAFDDCAWAEIPW